MSKPLPKHLQDVCDDERIKWATKVHKDAGMGEDMKRQIPYVGKASWDKGFERCYEAMVGDIKYMLNIELDSYDEKKLKEKYGIE